MQLQWIQPNAWKDMVYDLMNGEERIATYRPLNHWHQSAVVQGPQATLHITPERWQTRWTISEGGAYDVTTICGLFKNKGRFTTAEGDTYTWERTNLWTGRRVFRRVEEGGTERDVLHVNPAAWSFHTQADLVTLPAEIPQRDRVLLAGLAMHMIALERIFAVLMVVFVVLFIPIML